MRHIKKIIFFVIVASIVLMNPQKSLALLPSCPPDSTGCQGSSSGDTPASGDTQTGGDSTSPGIGTDGTGTSGDSQTPGSDAGSPGSSNNGTSPNGGGTSGNLQPEGDSINSSGTPGSSGNGSRYEIRPIVSVFGNLAPQESQCEQLGKVWFNDDSDDDGLTDIQESALGTDSLDPDTDFDSYFDGEEVCSGFDPLVVLEVNPVDWNLAKKLQGMILLQVERRGEAWYMYPNDFLRYYLRNGRVAYAIMRFLSLGITDANLAKIPVGLEPRFQDIDSDNDGLSDKMEEGLKTDLNNADSDSDGFADGEEVLVKNTNPLGAGMLHYDAKLIKRMKGKILLQVESRGEAWYVHPKDGKRYYMKDGNAAYQIMRFLSLGIFNSKINTLPIGSLRGKIH